MMKKMKNLDFSNTIWGEELLKEVDDVLIDSLTTLETISNK